MIGLDVRGGSKGVKTLDIARAFDKSERSVERCGTTTLSRLSDDESLEQLASDSATSSLEQSDISLENINGIYASVCCPTTQYLMPGLARVVGKSLGAKNIPMITMSMGCAGGVHAIQTAYNQLRLDEQEGETGSALVLIGDHISRALDKNSWDTAGIFSDGIASVVLSTDKKGKYNLRAVKSMNLDGDIQSMNILNPSENTADRKATFRMDGTKVFEFAYKETYPAIMNLLGLTSLPENCYFIPHQASGVVLKYLQKESKLRPDQIYTDGIGRFGNVTGASILFGLDDVLKRGLAQDRDIILGAFGAELAVGAVHLEKNARKV